VARLTDPEVVLKLWRAADDEGTTEAGPQPFLICKIA